MQKHYLKLVKLILEKEIISRTDAYDYLINKQNLTKEDSICILDALIENPLLNYNYKLNIFMPGQ